MSLTHLEDARERHLIGVPEDDGDVDSQKVEIDGQTVLRKNADPALLAAWEKVLAAQAAHEPALTRIAYREFHEIEEEIAVAGAARRKKQADERAKQQKIHDKKAAAIEVKVRESVPFCTFHDGQRTVRVDLSDGQVSREATRILAWALSNAFDRRLKASRQTTSLQPFPEWLSGISDQLRYAAQRGLIQIDKEITNA